MPVEAFLGHHPVRVVQVIAAAEEELNVALPGVTTDIRDRGVPLSFGGVFLLLRGKWCAPSCATGELMRYHTILRSSRYDIFQADINSCTSTVQVKHSGLLAEESRVFVICTVTVANVHRCDATVL